MWNLKKKVGYFNSKRDVREKGISELGERSKQNVQTDTQRKKGKYRMIWLDPFGESKFKTSYMYVNTWIFWRGKGIIRSC